MSSGLFPRRPARQKMGAETGKERTTRVGRPRRRTTGRGAPNSMSSRLSKVNQSRPRSIRSSRSATLLRQDVAHVAQQIILLPARPDRPGAGPMVPATVRTPQAAERRPPSSPPLAHRLRPGGDAGDGSGPERLGVGADGRHPAAAWPPRPHPGRRVAFRPHPTTAPAPAAVTAPTPCSEDPRAPRGFEPSTSASRTSASPLPIFEEKSASSSPRPWQVEPDRAQPTHAPSSLPADSPSAMSAGVGTGYGVPRG